MRLTRAHGFTYLQFSTTLCKPAPGCTSLFSDENRSQHTYGFSLASFRKSTLSVLCISLIPTKQNMQ